MKLKKVVGILFCAFLAKFIIACVSCPETQNYSYRYLSLKVDNLDNRGNEPVVALDSVPRRAFGIRLAFLLEKIVFGKGIVPSLFATTVRDCGPENNINSTDTLASFRVYTLDKFDATHDADSDVSDYFRMKWYDTNYLVISQFVTYSNQSFFFNFPENKKELDIFLLTAPETKGLYRFKVKVKFSDGREFSEVTKPLQLY